MGSKAEAEVKVVPVVDLSIPEKLKPGTESCVLTCNQLRHAFEEFGCVEVVWHEIPTQLHNSIFYVADDLFNLPLETKKQSTSDRPFHSYVGQLSFIPLYESIGIDNPTTFEGAQHFTNIMWPQGNDRFRETVCAYSKLVAEISEIVTRMVFNSYGVEELSCGSHMESTTYLLRFSKYRTRQEHENDLGLHAHTDGAFTSILHQDQVGGLQIKAKDGQWIDVRPSGSSFLVLAGDSLMAWSNDRIRSCEHQVIMKENKRRNSLGLFAFNSGIISVPKELLDEQHPLRYKPFNTYDYLQFTLTDESKKSKCAIKAYCGV